MELSKTFGVERGNPFEVKGYKGKEFRINTFVSGVEYLEIRNIGGIWDLCQVGVMCNVIAAAPSGIIHLPPPLTDEQRAVLMSLFTMGARYMGMTQEGWKRCFVNKPQKEFSGWTCGDMQCLTIASGMANCLDSLVFWSDTEPYDIGKALEVEG